MIMIDWLSSTTRTPDQVYTNERTTNIRLERSPLGEIIKEYRIGMNVKADPEPSSSRNFYVHTPDTRTLLMSGNPVKFLQGHNAFGSDDLTGLYLESGILLRQNAGLFPSSDSWDACQFLMPNFSRIDITRSYRFQSDAEKQDFIRYIAGTARTRHGAAKLFGSETAYFGLGSRRWSFKIYDKLAEYKKNNKGKNLDDELIDWLKGVARFELCLRSPELKVINHTVAQGNSVKLQPIWEYYYSKIDFNENATMTKNSHDFSKLTNAESKAFLQWQAGADLRSMMTTPTFYRLRKGIKKALGVDISTPPIGERTEQIKKPVRSDLDPAGWDPEPLEHKMFTPRDEVKKSYGFNS